MKTKVCLFTVSLLMSSSFSFAQADVFVAPFSGYSFGHSGLDIRDTTSSERSSLSFTESANMGVMLGVVTNDPGNMYFVYSRQQTDIRNGAFNPQTLSDVTVNYYHLGGSLYFPSGNFKPYVTASFGLTQMVPDSQYSNETRFSMGLGGGMAYDITSSVSIFAEVKAYGTLLDSSSALFCDGGSCRWYISGDLMWQSQANAGLSFRF